MTTRSSWPSTVPGRVNKIWYSVVSGLDNVWQRYVTRGQSGLTVNTSPIDVSALRLEELWTLTNAWTCVDIEFIESNEGTQTRITINGEVQGDYWVTWDFFVEIDSRAPIGMGFPSHTVRQPGVSRVEFGFGVLSPSELVFDTVGENVILETSRVPPTIVNGTIGSFFKDNPTGGEWDIVVNEQLIRRHNAFFHTLFRRLDPRVVYEMEGDAQSIRTSNARGASNAARSLWSNINRDLDGGPDNIDLTTEIRIIIDFGTGAEIPEYLVPSTVDRSTIESAGYIIRQHHDISTSTAPDFARQLIGYVDFEERSDGGQELGAIDYTQEGNYQEIGIVHFAPVRPSLIQTIGIVDYGIVPISQDIGTVDFRLAGEFQDIGTVDFTEVLGHLDIGFVDFTQASPFQEIGSVLFTAIGGDVEAPYGFRRQL